MNIFWCLSWHISVFLIITSCEECRGDSPRPFLVSTNGDRLLRGRTGFGSGAQDWGFVNVRSGAHMFWWLYFTTANVESYFDKPLIIWLQGGPGLSSSGLGNFGEIGPLDENLRYRNHTWVKDYNVLFIDSPVGSGFSYTKSWSEYARTNGQIAQDLVVCMKSFMEQFPAFGGVPTYIMSQSYGGKMAAEFAYVWYKEQKKGAIESNLKGVGLGSAWISPIDSTMSMAPYLLHTGMIDTQGYNKIMHLARLIRSSAEREEWHMATYHFSDLLMMIAKMTGNMDLYNILHKRNVLDLNIDPDNTEESSIEAAVFDDLMNSKVKKALSLNSTWKERDLRVFYALDEDFMKPVTDTVELLLDETDIKVFVYNGQLDTSVNTAGTLLWVEKLKWENATEWAQTPRKPLVVNSIIEGFFKVFGNLKMYWINRAGHMVPVDNPAATVAMLKDLTSNPF